MIKRLSKLPKRTVTVDDLLDRSLITEALDEITRDKDIDGILIFYRSRNGDFGSHWVNMPVKDRVLAIEILKHECMREIFTDE